MYLCVRARIKNAPLDQSIMDDPSLHVCILQILQNYVQDLSQHLTVCAYVIHAGKLVENNICLVVENRAY